MAARLIPTTASPPTRISALFEELSDGPAEPVVGAVGEAAVLPDCVLVAAGVVAAGDGVVAVVVAVEVPLGVWANAAPP